MKERSILMNAFSVRAILDGRKTMTRRVIKPQPYHETRCGSYWYWPGTNRRNSISIGCSTVEKFVAQMLKKNVCLSWPKPRCPYGVPGDRLWVRETWFPMQDVEACALANEPVDVAYKADYDAEGISREEARDVGIDRWRPSIFMPRWASRVMLEITDVRVERVQDISSEDVMAEGMYDRTGSHIADCHNAGKHFGPDQSCFCGDKTPQEEFAVLWDSVNTKKGFSFDVNPWAWIIEFDRLEKGAERERE